MKIQRIMNKSGDGFYKFDEFKDEEVNIAMERFDSLISKGYKAAKSSGNGNHEFIKKFNKEDDEVIFFEQLQGG